MIYYAINVFKFIYFEVLWKCVSLSLHSIYNLYQTYHYKYYIVPRKQITIIRNNDRYLKMTKIKNNY